MSKSVVKDETTAPSSSYEDRKSSTPLAENAKINPHREAIKRNDLYRLKAMHETLQGLKEGKVDLYTTLENIGTLIGGGGSEGISDNPTHDPEIYWIRNKYGYTKLNPQGIPFTKLYRLSIVLKWHPTIDLNTEPNLLSELEALQQRIAYVLHEEQELVDGYDATWGKR